MSRLLAISWDMPPLSGPRAVQVSRTLKQIVALGWESWVVCFGPRSSRYHQDPVLASSLRAPAGVTLVPVPSLEERLVFRALWRMVPPLKLLPDEKWVWIGAAARAAQRLAAERGFDVLVSFAQPFSDHLVGLRVRRATGLPWVAHFSDPWADSPYATTRQRAIWRRMEARVVREAAGLVFVTAEAADLVMANLSGDETMNAPHDPLRPQDIPRTPRDPDRTVDVPAVQADSLDDQLARTVDDGIGQQLGAGVALGEAHARQVGEMQQAQSDDDRRDDRRDTEDRLAFDA